MAKADLTAQRLRELLDYDPETGIFTRRTTNRRWKAGSVAGSIDGGGYALIFIDGVQYRAHRLAWLYVYGKFPSQDIDHRNGVRNDNRIANLRDVAPSVNAQNRHDETKASSGYRGVYLHRRSGLWGARVRANYKEISLGYFSSPEDAHKAREADILRLRPT